GFWIAALIPAPLLPSPLPSRRERSLRRACRRRVSSSGREFEPNLAGCARTRHTARADPQAVAFLCCRLNCRCDIRRILSNDRRRTSPRVDALALPRSFPLEDSYQSVACLRTSTPFDSLPSLVLS